MSLQVAVAAPFSQEGTRTLRENEFVVALSMDRDWFSPDQAKRLADVATEEGLLERDGSDLALTFDAQSVTIPEDFVPDEDILRERSTFERVLDALVADGHPKHEVVGAINACQQELAVAIEVAAIVHARRLGVDVDDHVESARAAVTGEDSA
ncbi:DUF2240 family protein [Halovivax gelatinilyticus]|uniref:DUF2240 family protein n=1 Tax=Halovivax gelatinilyticus TaxID=2961597 RepID=UPI0020CA7299|nr:DUF2240 family protein [Halovivax gelatinilyticus]